LSRLRGTRAGLELALALHFPRLPLRVEDGGGVAWSVGGPLPAPGPASFVVLCDKPINRREATDVTRLIDAFKPAHVGYRLRIKDPNGGESGDD
jgi:hypothetical protein